MFDKHTQSAQFSELDSGTHPRPPHCLDSEWLGATHFPLFSPRRPLVLPGTKA